MVNLKTGRGPLVVAGAAGLMLAAALFSARETWARGGHRVGPAQDEARLFLPAALESVARSEMPGVTPLPATPGNGGATMTPTAGISATATAGATATNAATAAPPTATATAAPPTPTPTATVATECRDILRNGDFELGPQAWDLTVTGQRQAASRAIQHASRVPVPPHGGEWLAWLGGANESFYDLASAGLTAYEPGAVVSATLAFSVAIITEETANRRPNDEARFMIEGERRNVRVEGTGISEEDFRTQRTWQARSVDVTSNLATDSARRLHLEVETDSTARTWFYFDDLFLVVCEAQESP